MDSDKYYIVTDKRPPYNSKIIEGAKLKNTACPGIEEHIQKFYYWREATKTEVVLYAAKKG